MEIFTLVLEIPKKHRQKNNEVQVTGFWNLSKSD